VVSHKTQVASNGDGGHYLSYCYNKQEKEWFRYDDNSVKCLPGDSASVRE